MTSSLRKSVRLQCQQKQPERRDSGKRPQGVRKARAQKPFRGSVSIYSASSEHSKQQVFLTAGEPVRETNRLNFPQPGVQKRPHGAIEVSADISIPCPKRVRAGADFADVRSADQETQFSSTESDIDPIDYWRRKQTWPREYFEPDAMSHLLAQRRSTPSLGRKRSVSGSLASSSDLPSDQRPREEKSAPYQDPRYTTLLETKGIFMNEDSEGPENESKNLCRRLLVDDQDVPQVSRFSDKIFKLTCLRIKNRNEAKVIQDITRLIVPSAEQLADFGAEHLDCLVEAVNAGWNNSMPVTKTRPQPDYSVGFKRDAFTRDQLDKLAPFIGDFIAGDHSYFMGTYYMYLPFLTCEVKCGAAALDIADRQNAHSMTLAVRAIIELFRLVKREAEIDRKILAFSVSHDHRTVRIYGHYAVIDGPETKFYHYPINTFDFTVFDGREKWTAYKFIKNVYDTWMPIHFKRLCSAINDIPLGLDFDVPSLPQDSGLSQDLESHHLSRSFAESTSQTGNNEGHSVIGDITPNTSFTGQGASKKPRRTITE